MRQITDIHEFNQIRNAARSLISIEPPWDALFGFPKGKYNHIYHIDFMYAHPEVFDNFQSLCRMHGDRSFYFIVLRLYASGPDADPVTYFQYTGSYPAFEVSLADTPQEFMKAMRSGDEHKIAIVAQLVAVFPLSLRWFVTMERGCDLGMIATMEPIGESDGFLLIDDEAYQSKVTRFREARDAFLRTN